MSSTPEPPTQPKRTGTRQADPTPCDPAQAETGRATLGQADCERDGHRQASPVRAAPRKPISGEEEAGATCADASGPDVAPAARPGQTHAARAKAGPAGRDPAEDAGSAGHPRRANVARRPCIALMGEFSAGKSTLANLLLGQAVSPVKVTATQLPPLRYRHGPPSCCRIGHDGVAAPIAHDAIGACTPADTRLIEVSLHAPLLMACDLLDMPGSSDPNMPPDLWDMVFRVADGVLWCTPATQAWRQSEAALWDRAPARLQARSLLLATRIDKIASGDRARVLKRLTRETRTRFAAVLPVSLTGALAAGNDPVALRASGAEAVANRLAELVEAVAADLESGGDAPGLQPAPDRRAAGKALEPVSAGSFDPGRAEGGPASAPQAASRDEPAPPGPDRAEHAPVPSQSPSPRRVVKPRRVHMVGASRTQRPDRGGSDGTG